MRNIYIIQMHTGSVPARIVKAFTRYPYSHVGISLDESCETIYSFGRKRPHNFLVGGFVKQKATDLFFQKFPFTQCRVFALAVTEAQYGALLGLLHGFEANADRLHYDFGGLALRTVFRIPVCFRRHYVCSHFAAKVLRDAGICRLLRKDCMAKPRDFEKISGAHEVYRGPYPII